MERVQNFALRPGYEFSIDGCTHIILRDTVEFGKVFYRPVNLHILQKHSVRRLGLLHRAIIQALVIEAENSAKLFFDINFVFHERNADKKGIYK